MYLRFIIALIFLVFFSCNSSEDNNTSKEKIDVLFSIDNSFKNIEGKKTLFINKKAYSAKIKIHQDYLHFNLTNDNTILNREKFKIYPVKNFESKHHLLEEIQFLLKGNDLIYPKLTLSKIRFNDTIINGIFQEDLNNILIEGNQRREGDIFKLEGEEINLIYSKKDITEEVLKEKIIHNNSFIECIVDYNYFGNLIAIFDFLNFNINQQELIFYINPISNKIEGFVYFSQNTSGKPNQIIENLFTKARSTKTYNDKIQFLQTDKTAIFLCKKYSLPPFKLDTLNNEFIPNCNKDFSFQKYFDLINDTLTLKKNHTTIDEKIFIPTGYTISLFADQKIDLINNSFFISQSNLNFIGTTSKPIIITSSDSSSQGFHIIEAKTKSILKNVHFSSFQHFNFQNWVLPSAVTFYRSPVKIDSCSFTDNYTEDGLNIFLSNFEIRNSIFKNSLSDAFDADYSNGQVYNCEFSNCGNDAIDVSGSKIDIVKSKFNHVLDKALSAGENSEMTADSLNINDCSLAVNSKDLSKIKISNSLIQNCEVVFIAFQKKEEFGPSKIVSKNVKYTNFKEENLIEEGSKLKIDGEKIHNYRDDVKKYLYGNEYGKKTVK